jgi:hypothetical protein
MKTTAIIQSIGAYGTAVAIGVYLGSGNGPGATTMFVAVSSFATLMTRRDWRHAAALVGPPAMTGEPPRPTPIRTYEVENGQSGRIPFSLSDADLFSRAS